MTQTNKEVQAQARADATFDSLHHFAGPGGRWQAGAFGLWHVCQGYAKGMPRVCQGYAKARPGSLSGKPVPRVLMSKGGPRRFWFTLRSTWAIAAKWIWPLVGSKGTCKFPRRPSCAPPALKSHHPHD